MFSCDIFSSSQEHEMFPYVFISMFLHAVVFLWCFGTQNCATWWRVPLPVLSISPFFGSPRSNGSSVFMWHLPTLMKSTRCFHMFDFRWSVLSICEGSWLDASSDVMVPRVSILTFLYTAVFLQGSEAQNCATWWRVPPFMLFSSLFTEILWSDISHIFPSLPWPVVKMQKLLDLITSWGSPRSISVVCGNKAHLHWRLCLNLSIGEILVASRLFILNGRSSSTINIYFRGN